MTSVLETLHEEHKNIARLLNAMENQIGMTGDGEESGLRPATKHRQLFLRLSRPLPPSQGGRRLPPTSDQTPD